VTGWYVVSTHAHQETRAQINLARQGFHSWFPTMWRSRRHARRIDTVRTPMFPGYLFVRFDPEQDPWGAIKSTVGVRKLLCAGDLPARVPEGFVTALRASVDDDGTASMHNDGWMKPGVDVKIVSGPFVDSVGTLVYLAARDRVALLLQVLGREVVVLLPRRALVPAA